MPPFAEFLHRLFREGRAVLRQPPGSAADQGPEALASLREAHANYRLQVAGPPLDFDPRTALAAAHLVYHASWFLVSHREPDSELERLLTMPGTPRSPAEHLAADLRLRFLPQIHRRAKAQNPADRLTGLLAEVLRRWPLSGVLADVDDGPLVAPDFGDHAGLWMLYAERLARHPRPAWVPEGAGRVWMEFVYRELGEDPAALPRSAKAASSGPVDSGEGSDD